MPIATSEDPAVCASCALDTGRSSVPLKNPRRLIKASAHRREYRGRSWRHTRARTHGRFFATYAPRTFDGPAGVPNDIVGGDGPASPKRRAASQTSTPRAGVTGRAQCSGFTLLLACVGGFRAGQPWKIGEFREEEAYPIPPTQASPGCSCSASFGTTHRQAALSPPCALARYGQATAPSVVPLIEFSQRRD